MHGWPTFYFLLGLDKGVMSGISPVQFLAGQLLYIHPLGAILWVWGRQFRTLGWIWLSPNSCDSIRDPIRIEALDEAPFMSWHRWTSGTGSSRSPGHNDNGTALFDHGSQALLSGDSIMRAKINVNYLSAFRHGGTHGAERTGELCAPVRVKSTPRRGG